MNLVLQAKIEQMPQVMFYPVLEDNQAIIRLIEGFGYEDQSAILTRLKAEKFVGKKSQVFVINEPGLSVILLGTGQSKKLDSEDWRVLAGNIIAYLQKYSAKNIGLIASQWLKNNSNIELLGQSLAEGLNLASYEFVKYKKPDKNKININIENIFVEINSDKKNKFQKGWDTGLLMTEATNLARDLVNEPAGVMTPTFLADTARQIAKANPNISVKILDKEACQKLGMNAFLGVDQGSDQPLQFIHLIYKPAHKSKDIIALVGKGITFDSGGLNIKTGDSMSQMKVDMAGSATVLGIFASIGKLKPKSEVHGIVAACENMPSGTALKPGDVISNMQGKTIEIGNTDAEGRVTLADSLAYAQKKGAKTIIDLATLTGACVIALGPEYTALFANDQGLAKDLLKTAGSTGEKIWQLPLPDEYKELNKSNIADINNIPNTRYGGAITAGLFLQEFIHQDIKWSHWDIAGPAYAEKPFNSYTPQGGVGFGVRTLLTWLLANK